MAKEKTERKRFLTPPFVLSFPSLFVARRPEDGEGKPKFGATAIWTPAKFSANDKALYQAILKELDVVARENFRKPWKELPDNIKRGLRDGAAKEDVAGYGPGTRFANMTTLNRPGVIDKDKNPIGPEHDNEDLIYPGCICRAKVSVWAYGGAGSKSTKYKGVGIGLLNLQKLKDGARLDNRVAAEDDFDEDIDAEWLDDEDTDNDGDDEDFG